MKINYYDKYFIILFFLCLISLQKLKAQSETLYVDSNFKSINLKEVSKTNHSGKNKLDSRDYFYFGFKNEFNTIYFNIKNTESTTQNIVLELSNALIEEIVLCKYQNDSLVLVNKTGIHYPFSSRLIEHRLFAFPIKLNPNEATSYQLKLKKEIGRPLVTSVFIKSEKAFTKQNFIQQLIIGLYYGISILSVLFSLFAFYYLRKSTYLIYGGYIVFLGLFISSYLGLFSQLFLSPETLFSKYTNYVIFSEISLILFAIFSQKILEAKKYMPKLRRMIIGLIILLVIIRLLLHFAFTDMFSNYVSVFMKFWYGFFLLALILIIIEVFTYYKKNNNRTSFFAIAYLFMMIGTFMTILYHSFGLVNTFFYGLPILFYASFIEIIFLTFTVVFMVKDIYDERNMLSNELVKQQKNYLNAFVKGEDRERMRISKELHDNIGSKLGYLKRFVSDKFKDEAINETIDAICSDVRNLSHDISPSDLKLVGFEKAVAEFANNISEQTTIQVDFNSYQFPESLKENTETQLYRVVQEAFNNIIKHAEAKHVDVQLIGHDDCFTISIEDDGKGFDLTTKKRGLGLKNMYSRIKQINGTLSIDSKRNSGTSLLITIPN